jgi:hypothetical protein
MAGDKQENRTNAMGVITPVVLLRIWLYKTFIEALAFTYEYHLEMVGKKVVFHPNAPPNQNHP